MAQTVAWGDRPLSVQKLVLPTNYLFTMLAADAGVRGRHDLWDHTSRSESRRPLARHAEGPF